MNFLQKELDKSQTTIISNKDSTTVLVRSAKNDMMPSFPLIVINEDFFYTTEGFEPATINGWKRLNGWVRPINILLPLLWITWISVVGFYYGFFRRVFFSSNTQLALDIVVAISSLAQCVLTIYCISADVEDDVVIKANKPRNVDYVKISGVPVIDPSSLYCQICQVHVKPLTKHCKTCNKCVERYDHHCIFLSTCIGRKNYQEFITSITIASIVSLYFGIVSLYSFILFFINKSYFNTNLLLVSDGVSDVSTYFILFGIIVYCALALATSIGLGHLAIFHYRLSYIGITTVGYHDIRRARGPLLWDINTADFRKRQKDAERFRVNFHELN